ncbi:MAG TPA: hypothetical protein VG095_10565, partial [Chthoniobacterales bacterium]|nr:hypothetical protein [Chthoniobacterales bacterium]
EKERRALFYFWREVGRRMNIRDLPDSYEAFVLRTQMKQRSYPCGYVIEKLGPPDSAKVAE